LCKEVLQAVPREERFPGPDDLLPHEPELAVRLPLVHVQTLSKLLLLLSDKLVKMLRELL